MKAADLMASWWTGGLLLGLGLACSASALFRMPPTLFDGVIRRQRTKLPPFELSTDRDRVQGLVFEPLCPQPDGVIEVFRPVTPVAACSGPDASSGAVQVHLRSDLQLGDRSATPEDILDAVNAWQVRYIERGQGDQIWVPDAVRILDARTLVFTPAAEQSGTWLRAKLADVLVAQRDGDCVVGTGPWRETHCQWIPQDPVEPRPDPADSPAWEDLPPLLRDSGAVTDILVLERRDRLDRRRIVTVGLDYQQVKADACPGFQAAPEGHKLRLSQQSDVLACVIQRTLSGLPGERLDILTGLEGDQVRRIRTAPRQEQDPQLGERLSWDFQRRGDDRVTWAVVNPDLEENQRRALVARVRHAAGKPGFYTDIDGPPVRSLMPAVFEPFHLVPDAPDKDALDLEVKGEPVLLTHTFWEPVARRLVESAEVQLASHIVGTDDEAGLRGNGDYAVSILSVGAAASSHPAGFLAASLTVWFETEHRLVKEATAISDLELKDPGAGQVGEGLDALLEQLDSYIVPLGAPPTWTAVHRQLVGWDAAAQRLDPETTRLADAWLPNIGDWGLLFSLLGALGLGTTTFWRREQHRRQQELYRDISAFHHDLVSPLTAVMAEADHLETQVLPATGDTAIAREISLAAQVTKLESSIASLLVDDLKIAVDPGRVVHLDAGKKCELIGEILKPELERLRQRADREGLHLHLEPLGLDRSCRVGLGPRAMQRIVQNLLDNAVKYRRPGSDEVRLNIHLSIQGDEATLEIADWGSGFDKDLDPDTFFELAERGQRPEDQAVEGQGVGLATVKRLVESAGGRVELARYALPSIVRLYLPRA